MYSLSLKVALQWFPPFSDFFRWSDCRRASNAFSFPLFKAILFGQSDTARRKKTQKRPSPPSLLLFRPDGQSERHPHLLSSSPFFGCGGASECLDSLWGSFLSYTTAMPRKGKSLGNLPK